MKTADELVQQYLNFSGERTRVDFMHFMVEVYKSKLQYVTHTEEFNLLRYLELKLTKGIRSFGQDSRIDVRITERNKTDLLNGIKKLIKEKEYYWELTDEEVRQLKPAGLKKARTKAKPSKKPVIKKSKNGKGDLGKIVDQGKTAAHGNSDNYWRRQGLEIIFKANDPEVRSGFKIPDSYEYANVKYLERYYSLSGIEFGNWLSQQDRINYLSGLGLSLFDLHKAIGFKPEQISINGKLSVAFGARGRGRAKAHFEPGSFAINLTRYRRPATVEQRPINFNRVNLILKQGGVGSFAHEYGHALDTFGGLHIEKGDSIYLSREGANPKPDLALMKKGTLRGLMEKLLFKICWKSPNIRSNYYARLSQAVSTKYYFLRAEIFARAFEVYVHYKLHKAKYYNVFLHKTKYRKGLYLNENEMKALEKDFDALINALKKHLKAQE